MNHPPLLLGNTVIFLGLALQEWCAEEWNQVCGSTTDGLYRAPSASFFLKADSPAAKQTPSIPILQTHLSSWPGSLSKADGNILIHHPLLVASLGMSFSFQR